MKKETRNLVIFFAATFIWTWACYTPIAVTGNSPYQMPWMILLILGGAGPSIVGVVMVLLTYDKEQRRAFWSRAFSPKRIPALIWLVVFLIFPLIAGLCVALDRALGGPAPGMEQFASLMANPVMWPLAAFISFMSGPWSEEFGWRGYTLEPLIDRFKVVPASIILGLIWGVWHLPLFYMPATWHGQIGFGLSGFWMFIGMSVGLALLMSWVYLNTSRSILSAMLMHFTSNFTAQLIAPSSPLFEVLRASLLIVLGLVLCVWASHRAGADRQSAVSAPQPT